MRDEGVGLRSFTTSRGGYGTQRKKNIPTYSPEVQSINIIMGVAQNKAEVACSGRPLKALEDDVRDEGVGAVPTALQAEMMPSEKKSCFFIAKKFFGVLEFGRK